VGPKAYKQCNCELSQESYHLHHHQATVQLCHLLPRSGLTHPEDSSVYFTGFCCPLVCRFLLPLVSRSEAFRRHVANKFFFCPIFPQRLDCYLIPFQSLYVGRDSSVGIVTRYGLDIPGIESRWRRDFTPLQTGSEAQPASYTMGTGRGELNYLAHLSSESISAPYSKQCFFRGGGYYPPE